MKSIIPIILLFVTSYVATAQQNVPFEKSYFDKSQKKALKQAIADIEFGEQLLEQNLFEKAMESYINAYNFNPNNATLNYRIGYCILYAEGKDKHEAIPYLEKAVELDDSDPITHYYLGQAYHDISEWDKAISSYQKAKSIEDVEMLETLDLKIKQCHNGKELAKKPVRAFIDPVIGTKINTSSIDFGPVINADESIMMFTSRRSVDKKEPLDADGMPFEDIYITYRAEDGTWDGTANMGKPTNSDEHDSSVGLSPDGTVLFIYREGDLYECDQKGGEWQKPKKLPKSINTNDKETSASVSPDGKMLYFVSNRADMTMGGLDIFVCDLNDKGEWDNTTNIGAPINTKYDEEGVFIHPDGKTLYFSSNGKNSIGGYDIFYSKFEDGKWSEPVNMGIPINTPGDDVFFVINANGRRGYYASAKPGGEGSQDIYVITILGPEKPMMLSTEDNLLAGTKNAIRDIAPEPKVELSTSNLTLFKGITVDDKSDSPVGAKITIMDNSTNEEIAVKNSNSSTGKFIVPLPAGKNYGISVEAESYLFHSENFNLPEGGNYQIVEKEIRLKKVEVGMKIVLRNIFFDFDKATLRPESKAELDKLIQLLNENPTIDIELGAHTDSRGSDSYNMDLSERRAKSVVEYLREAGIPGRRLVSKGYGETEPIATNKTDEDRQLNRRTEFKILKK